MIGKAIDRMGNWVNDSQIDKPDGGGCMAYRVDFREEEFLLLLERLECIYSMTVLSGRALNVSVLVGLLADGAGILLVQFWGHRSK